MIGTMKPAAIAIQTKMRMILSVHNNTAVRFRWVQKLYWLDFFFFSSSALNEECTITTSLIATVPPLPLSHFSKLFAATKKYKSPSMTASFFQTIPHATLPLLGKFWGFSSSADIARYTDHLRVSERYHQVCANNDINIKIIYIRWCHYIVT